VLEVLVQHSRGDRWKRVSRKDVERALVSIVKLERRRSAGLSSLHGRSVRLVVDRKLVVGSVEIDAGSVRCVDLMMYRYPSMKPYRRMVKLGPNGQAALLAAGYAQKLYERDVSMWQLDNPIR
jgi:hypothetical protein